MTRFAIAAFVAGFLASPVIAVAQTEADSGWTLPPTGAPRVALWQRAARMGLELSFLVPRGDFKPDKALAVGYGVAGAVGLGPRRMLDIGAAFRSIAHGSRTIRDTIEIKNMLRTLTMSGRIAAPLRHARPYIGGSVGAAYFGTETMVEECCDDEGDREWVLDDIRHAQFRPTASARVGLLVDLFTGGGARGSVFSLDLGVEDHYGRRATYQTGGDGPLTRSGTNYRVYSLGVSVRSP